MATVTNEADATDQGAAHRSTQSASDGLENSVDDAIAACGGDARAAVRVLLVATNHQQAEIDELGAEIARLAAAISRGYSRGRRDRYLMRTKAAGSDGEG
jgi:hypothetical protein